MANSNQIAISVLKQRRDKLEAEAATLTATIQSLGGGVTSERRRAASSTASENMRKAWATRKANAAKAAAGKAAPKSKAGKGHIVVTKRGNASPAASLADAAAGD